MPFRATPPETARSLSGGAGPLVVAHRGAWDSAPQNSLQALQDAITVGCEMVEFDVRRTRDERLVAVHNARVSGAKVASLDLEDVRARVDQGQAPLLEEMVELSAGRITLDVELKDPAGVEQALAILGRRLEPEAYVVTSFFDAALVQARAAAPAVRTGLLLRPGSRPSRLEARLQHCGASFLGVPLALARTGVLAWAAKRGWTSYVWTVNDRRWLRSMLSDPRVAAVITDRPGLALDLRREGMSASRSAAQDG